MKKLKISSMYIWSFLTISLLFINQCDINEDAVYRRIRDHADQIRVINTHEHQHWPEEYGDYQFRFYHLIAASYLASDISSAGANGYDWELMDSLSLNELWDVYGKALNYTRTTSYYSQFVKGFQKLYGFNHLYFTKDNIAALSTRIEDNYKNYKSWFDEAFHRAGYELMFLDQYWKPFNTGLDTNYFALVFHINPLVSESSRKPEKGTEPGSIYKEADNEGFEINNLDDYLEYCDHLFKKNIGKKTVCLKNSQAYSRTLEYEDVP
jgi:hypothetical protein